MTHDEAKTVIGILKEADGGCSVCVVSLVRDFKKAFPAVLTDDEILEVLDNGFIEKNDL